MEKTATIYSYTIVRVPAKAFTEKAPFAVAVLTDDEGKRFSSFVEGYVDGQEVKVGEKVTFSYLDGQGREVYHF